MYCILNLCMILSFQLQKHFQQLLVFSELTQQYIIITTNFEYKIELVKFKFKRGLCCDSYHFRFHMYYVCLPHINVPSNSTYIFIHDSIHGETSWCQSVRGTCLQYTVVYDNVLIRIFQTRGRVKGWDERGQL